MTTELYHSICDYLRTLIADTEWDGNVYAVGGCCRDELMGLPIKDLDLAVNLPDGGVGFARWLYKRGLTASRPTEFVKYGTAKLHLSAFPDDEIEVVQTRREKYTDRTSRNQETVFGSIKDDCLRRDLTINSLYYDISRREYIDITGRGVDDIRNHVIRTPVDPDITYDDDPVRILRCVRFAARFGWDIEPATYDALVRNVDRLSIVSIERVRGELEKMLLCDTPSAALKLLHHIGAMKYVIPELRQTFTLMQNHYHFGSVWAHTLKVVDGVPADLTLRMAALLHDIGKVRTAKIGRDGEVHFYGHERCGRQVGRILFRLRYRADFVRKVTFLVENHMLTKQWGDTPGDDREADVRRLQYRCVTPARFDHLMLIIDADNNANAENYCLPGQVAAIRRISERLVERGQALFDYRWPLTPATIVKMKRLKSESTVAQYYDYLTRYLYRNPLLTKEEMVKLIAKFTPQKSKIATATKSRDVKKTDRYRRKRHGRGRNRGNNEAHQE